MDALLCREAIGLKPIFDFCSTGDVLGLMVEGPGTCDASTLWLEAALLGGGIDAASSNIVASVFSRFALGGDLAGISSDAR